MDKNKVLNLVGTGTAVGALLIIATLFSNGGFSNWSSVTAAAGDNPVQAIQIDESADLEAQNAQLQEALTLMQDREAEYQARINEANDMLMNPEPAPAYGGEYEEEEEMEEEEMEEEGNEMGEEMDEEDDDDDEEEEDEDEDEGGVLGLDLGLDLGLGFGEKDDD